MTKKEKEDILINIYGYVWMICWFTAIWTPEFYSMKLFLTGSFSLLLGILTYSSTKESDKNEKI